MEMEQPKRINKELAGFEFDSVHAARPKDYVWLGGVKEDIESLLDVAEFGKQVAERMMEVKPLDIDVKRAKSNGLTVTRRAQDMVESEVRNAVSGAIERTDKLLEAYKERRYQYQVEGDYPKSSGRAGLIISAGCFALDRAADAVSVVKWATKPRNMGEFVQPVSRIIEK